MNTLIASAGIVFIIGIGLCVFIVIDILHAVTTDENPFNLMEKDVDLFDREDR